MQDKDQDKRPAHLQGRATGLSRRTLLRYGAAAGLAIPAGAYGGHVVAGSLLTPSTPALPEFPICLTAADGQPAATGPLTPIKLAWNATGICTAAAPLAKESGIFARHGLDVDFVNFGGSTEALLEAIATGKADAGIGMALRWLKPLEQGFDVRITAGLHGGCIRLLGSQETGVTRLEDLKGKTVAISDQASPAKNFFSLLLAKRGIDPDTVQWRNYPAEALQLAVDKGEAQALADNDPRTWIFLKESKGKLIEVASNLSAEFQTRSCCVLAIRNTLLRDDKRTATALTVALLESAHLVAARPEEGAKAFASYGGKGSQADLADMLRSHTHNHNPVGAALKKEIADYVDELKLVNVIKPSTNSARFADRVYADVLS
ncbi:ABC transporter substrate-binding protein [Azorhizobium oxalatiphilum]|uniref:ABC transporter substrate-binding protein n=1 Tax=Azorhizobium oxalatiphilum TaxID=980631 RepID=A0A917BLB4_9HYPH|nr:ABC transporter substrate-binding protein [Azorhizobium oxalatiphilum]GGF50075.1 ABC transporter substrate-binding protein [Azorhizobium oxalatiphilum]